jgi:hypothetical protein
MEAAALGLEPAAVWPLTLRELYAVARGVRQRERLADRRALGLAWHTAALTRAKTMPSLERLIQKALREPATPQTPQHMLAQARLITAALGGHDLTTPATAPGAPAPMGGSHD